MTYREFYNSVKDNEFVSDEMREFAVKAIKALDNKNESRKNGNSKTAQETKANRELILNAMVEGEVYTAKQIADTCNFSSTQKATGMLTQMVKDGLVNVKDFTPTGKKKDTVKGYFVGEDV